MADVERELEILARIRANQEAFVALDSTWKRVIPFWRLRHGYRLLKANEALFAELGFPRPRPFSFETDPGLSASILRRLIGA